MDTIEIYGQEFALGCHERTALPGTLRPCLDEAIAPISQDRWKPCDFSPWIPPVALQGSHGACVGAQCADAMMAAAAAAGLTWQLSPWDLYRKICGGRDQGGSIHDALKVLHFRGVCSLASVPDFTLSARDTEELTTEAARHVCRESYDCPDRANVATAVQCGFPTPLGVAVYGNFGQLEEIEGKICVPRPAGRLRGLHCVLGCGFAKIGGQWRVKIATKSWGLEWGDQGCAWYCLDWMDSRYLDAWALRSVSYSE